MRDITKNIQIVKNEYLPVLPIRERVSVVIPAYQTDSYISECLESIENQTYFEDNDNFEVLIGVDACNTTLGKLNEIRHKYRNLSVFMMEKNVGPYITLNTLIELVTSDNIIFFGSDDIMKPELVNEVMNASKDADVVRIGYNSFVTEKKDACRVFRYANGAIYFRREILDLAGGYQPWKCVADAELICRIARRAKTNFIGKVLFYYRVHYNSVTKRTDIGLGSELRKHYLSLIRFYEAEEDIYIRRVTGKFRKVC
jgi:glycosyltransferase involved in cell wall biosynthesis